MLHRFALSFLCIVAQHITLPRTSSTLSSNHLCSLAETAANSINGFFATPIPLGPYCLINDAPTHVLKSSIPERSGDRICHQGNFKSSTLKGITARSYESHPSMKASFCGVEAHSHCACKTRAPTSGSDRAMRFVVLCVMKKTCIRNRNQVSFVARRHSHGKSSSLACQSV